MPPSTDPVYRVLIVDDDEDARILLLRALRKTHLAVEAYAAVDGVEALDLVAELRPHLVITDIMMPRMDGFQLCVLLRASAETAAIPILIVTALEDEGDRQRGLAAGADGYFTKPLDINELTARLHELLGQR